MHEPRTCTLIAHGSEHADVHRLAKCEPEHASEDVDMIRVGTFGHLRFDGQVPSLLARDEEDLAARSVKAPELDDVIIDNDASTVEMLSHLFRREGYTVYTAFDGAEGVALATAHRPDVIVCDLLMERMDGFQVVQAVRARPELSRTVVIVVSAKSYRPDIARARELGADAYLVKPIVLDELVATVRRGREARVARRMTATFWGTRGSIATPGPTTTVYGGNTACVEVRVGEDVLIFDSGTGIRELGLALAEEFRGRPGRNREPKTEARDRSRTQNRDAGSG